MDIIIFEKTLIYT